MNQRSTEWLAGIAFVGVSIFTGTAAALQAARPDYDPLRVPLSFYLLGPGGSVLQLAYYALATGMVCLALAFWQTNNRQVRSPGALAAFILGAIGVVLTATFDTDLPGTTAHSMHGVIHGISAGVAFLATLAGMALQSWRLRRADGWHGTGRLAWPLALLAIAWLVVYVAFSRSQPHGLLQKVLIALIMLWLGGAALATRRHASRGRDTGI
ncbi:MAG: DUF998 domain-containing protein [Gammaproteobacteria bacterium]|jgi:hypothetical protein